MAIYNLNGDLLSGINMGYDSFVRQDNYIKEKSQPTPQSVSIAKWEIPNQPNTWADSTWTSEDVVQNLYDPFLSETFSDGYSVTKEILGADEGVNIYNYTFTPANYTRTILLSAGMHSHEITAIFSLARLLHYVVDDPTASEITQYLRNNVRIFVIPILDSAGFSHLPRRYGTATGTNQSRNFTWVDDDGGNAWDKFEIGDPWPASWSYKGAYPFSEKQTRIMRDWLMKHQYQAEFWLDLHTGAGWSQDVWYYYIDEDPILAPKIKALEPWLSEKFALKRGIAVSNLENRVEDRWTSYKLRYAVKHLGIPCSTIELVSRRFGGEEAGSDDIQMYLYQLANIIGAGLSSDNVADEWQLLATIKNKATARRINAILT